MSGAGEGALRHAWYDDALAFVTGTLFIAFGVAMFSHVAHMSDMARGATLAVTLMLPCPPNRIRATAVGSSPE